MNKKGFFNIFLVFAAIGLFVYTYVVIYNLQTREQVIGEKSDEIIKTYKKAERDLLFIDKSAEYSLFESINTFNKNGGLVGNSDCGYYEGYSLWQTDKKSCAPAEKEIKQQMFRLVGYRLSEYLRTYELGAIPLNNYDYFIYENKSMNFAGIALKNIYYIDKSLKYSIKPSFNVRTKYLMLEHYYNVRSNITRLLEKTINCENKGEKLGECVKKTLTEFTDGKYEWTIDCDKVTKIENNEKTRQFPICVTDKSTTILDIAKEIKSINPVIKFAIYILDLPPAQPDIEAINQQGADNTLILKWKKGEESDISNYILYYSSEIQLNQKTEDLKKNDKVKTIELQKDGEQANFEIGKCNYDNTAGQFECAPKTEEKLYSKEGYLFYPIKSLEKSKKYRFAVTAKDNSGKEVESIDASKIVEAQLVDNLAPSKTGFSLSTAQEDSKNVISVKITSPPTQNIDGTPLTDLSEYYIFTKEGQCDDTLINAATFTKIKSGETESKIQKEPGTYCVGVIAVDNSKNPLEIRNKEGSLTEQELIIKPEYSKIILELANPQQITIQ